MALFSIVSTLLETGLVEMQPQARTRKPSLPQGKKGDSCRRHGDGLNVDEHEVANAAKA